MRTRKVRDLGWPGWLLVTLLSALAADVSAAAVKGRRRSHCGNRSTGFIAAPEMASAAARLMSAKSYRVMSRSSGILPAMNRSTRRGMKSRGRLSPWITPRNSPAALQPRHLETDLRTGASAADQDAGAETSQPIYGKPKHGRPPTLIAHVPEARIPAFNAGSLSTVARQEMD